MRTLGDFGLVGLSFFGTCTSLENVFLMLKCGFCTGTVLVSVWGDCSTCDSLELFALISPFSNVSILVAVDDDAVALTP